MIIKPSSNKVLLIFELAQMRGYWTLKSNLSSTTNSDQNHICHSYIWWHLKLELSTRFCSTKWPLALLCVQHDFFEGKAQWLSLRVWATKPELEKCRSFSKCQFIPECRSFSKCLFIPECRGSVGSSVASSLSGSGGPDGSDYTFGFSLSGVGLRQQSRRRHSLRPDTSLPFDKQGADPADLVTFSEIIWQIW